MTKVVTYKFLLMPTTAQKKRIDRWVGACRYVYNLAKETKEEAYRKGVRLSKFDLHKQLPDLKDIEWIKDVDAQALQDVVDRLDLSYQKFFKGAGYPKWAKKGQYNSFRFKKGRIVESGIVNVPKLGNIRFKDTRGLDHTAVVKNVIVKSEGGRYYASIVMEREFDLLPASPNVIGVDMGVAHFATTSDGEFVDAPMFFKESSSQLRILQRKLERQKKFGANWKKTKAQVTKLHRKVANQRKDYLQKISTKMISENQAIIVEDLKIKNMTARAKEKNVKAKSGLNRSMLDMGVYSFFEMLEYKADWYGREVVKVDPKYTSQTCNSCGHVSKDNRKSQSRFVCEKCGHKSNADVNAAQNILEKGVLHIRQREAVACA